MGLVAIPRLYMGQTLDSAEIQTYLIECNPGFHFDVGGNLDIWHPRREQRQGVWFEGRHICSMDRGLVPETPIWSVREARVRVKYYELTFGEHDDPMTFWETVADKDGTERQTGYASVVRKERDRILLVGWRHTFRQILKRPIAGLTQAGLEARFRIDLSPKDIDPPEVLEAPKIESRILVCH